MSMQRFVSALLLVAAEAACNRSAHSYLERGNSFFLAGKYQEAELDYRAALGKKPQFAEADYRLALTEIQLRRGEAAMEALQKAVDLDPTNDRYGIELADLSL